MAGQPNISLTAQMGRQQSPPIGHICLSALLALASPHSNILDSSQTCRPLILLVCPHEHTGSTCNTHISIESILSYLQQSQDELQASGAGNNGPGLPNSVPNQVTPQQLPQVLNNHNDHGDQYNPIFGLPEMVQSHSTIAASAAATTSETSIPTLQDDVLFENYLNDSEFTSMFSNDNFPDEPAGMEDAFSSSNPPGSSISSSPNNEMASSTTVLNASSAATVPPRTLVAPQATATPPINTTNGRFNCTHPNCSASFNRISDLRRHDRAHGVPSHPCTVNGCLQQGVHAFYRRDKLLDHMRKKHGLDV
ncbi:hypothetical protein EG329_007787 [Mollisiaceae sp. DMI_Dod_QoI]|nr:hypothetical protein EG329_007787 [Helotiales sp. DMI_Dod_QoI]